MNTKNILFISDHLKSGGKERRLTELLIELKKRNEFNLILALLEGEDENTSIDYRIIFDINIPIYYLGNKSRWQLPIVILKLCKKENINIVNNWAHSVYTYLIAPSKYLLRIPIISNSITSARISNSIFELLKIKGTYPICNAILSNSHQALEVFNVPHKKRKVIYNGFRTDRIKKLKDISTVRNSLSLNTEFIVAMAAEYSSRKDYPTYIKAANIVLTRGYDVTFLGMGSGDKNQYKNYIQYQNSDRILLLERQIDVESIFNACNIGVLSSKIEGVPNSILEFMALGKPVIANICKSVGTGELIDDNINGYLIEPDNPEVLADKIIYLLENEKVRLSMGIKGQEIVKNKFGINKMVNEFSLLFNNFLKTK
ncbi:MAG: glycosyltransferase [Bacteroidales bacterium]|nr:glycosyltransferase [Bacteroidales bacterium]